MRRLIIDGYNLLRGTPRYSGLTERDIDTARERLIADLGARVADGADVTVVFDGGGNPESEGVPSDIGGITVIFSPYGVEADAVIAMLREHDVVAKVFYPEESEVARRQMRDFGGMVSFLAESDEEAVALVARTKLFQLAESLGGVESLIEVPARMTHASTADAPFAAPGNLVRLSVGIEAAEDLVSDLDNALVPAAVARA